MTGLRVPGATYGPPSYRIKDKLPYARLEEPERLLGCRLETTWMILQPLSPTV